MNECIFCKIVTREMPSQIVHETDQLIVFPDLHPAADVHLLIVPKKHVRGLRDLDQPEYANLLAEIYQVVNKLVEDHNLASDAYRVAVNGGKAQVIPHLHFHFLGGRWNKLI